MTKQFKNPDKKSIPELESSVLEFWKQNKVFEKSVENRPKDNQYVFYDGPPFISGLPHYGHIIVSLAKDVIPRYWTMRGKRVERVWGWDAHGLTVENKVQKKLGIPSRKDIVSFGLEKFTEECYVYTSETSAEWPYYIDRIARWVDMENAYKTIDQDYMESVMWAFKQLYDKGLIYEGDRTSLFCTTCGTPVSNFEVAMDNTYKEVVDPSVMVKFPITSDGALEGLNVLAWTTTPWTLPSNRGLVVDENETYVVVESEGEKHVVAKPRLEAVFAKQEFSVEKEIKGSDLVGLTYEPPYTFYAAGENDFKVYAFEGMVHMEEGTGIVHSAPGFGMVDTEMGQHFGLTTMMTVDDEGKFIPGNNGENPFEAMYYADANKVIRRDLRERKLMFRDDQITHRFPYHDRCDTLLIQKAQNSWFIDVNSIRENLLKYNEDVNWVPDHLKHGRFEKGIEQAPDWCISRSRFWATPMPVWEAPDGDRIVIGSVAELEELSGQKVKNLHRPFIDEITIEKDGKIYTRREEVLDSWFEAGSMPYASIHYPFENKEKFERNFPGDYIVEYIAQTRAWFYVMHVLGAALFETNSFKNVIGYGVLAGNDGRKMSKTYGNYTDPKEVLTNIGGDALRLYFMSSHLMNGGNANFDDKELRTKLNNVLNPLWNSTKFLIMYSNEHNWDHESAVESENELDKWILVRLYETMQAFVEGIEAYKLQDAFLPLESFVDDLSRWYVRRSRDRISAGDPEALSTLYKVLTTFCKAAAPAMPFMAESIYQHLNMPELGENKESVHLCDYPEYATDFLAANLHLKQKMQNTRDIVSAGLGLRSDVSIKTRQPLSTLFITSETKTAEDFATELIVDEMNIKELQFGSTKEIPGEVSKWVSTELPDFKVYLDTELTEELEVEGNAREIMRTIQDLRKKQGLDVSQDIRAAYEATELNKKSVQAFESEIKEKVGANELIPGTEFSIEAL